MLARRHSGLFLRRLCALVAFAGVILTCASAQTLTGAGGSFPNPIYARWFAEYAREHPGIRINYQPVGSGAGLRQITAGVVDFGATESPLAPPTNQPSHSALKLLYIPTLLGAVVPVYHLPGSSLDLRFSPEVLAGIYLGHITAWNDPRLQQDNPAAKLPALPIVPVYRADGSGTTFVFTDFLSKVSPEFASRLGRYTAVSWPVGIGGKGNEGVTGLVRSTPGAIGYAELSYTGQAGLQAGAVRNTAGAWVKATPQSIAAAAQAELASVPEDFRVSITAASGAASYPIASYTWLLVRAADLGTPKGQLLAGFLDWMLDHGEPEAISENYAPLPEPLAARVRVVLRRTP